MSQAVLAGSASALPATTDKSGLPIGPPTRAAIEARIEWLIGLLDASDGDPELELDDEDCCCAGDDLGGAWVGAPWYLMGPGDPEDAEDDDPAGDPLDLGEAEPWRGVLLPAWGEDQSLGPTNEAEAWRAWHREQLGLAVREPVWRPASELIDLQSGRRL